MAFQVSPGINVSEIDLTTVVPAVSTTVGAIAGVFRWGPTDTRVPIGSENELARRFGKPYSNTTWSNAETFFSAANYLSYSNNLFVVRVVSNTALNAAETVANAALLETQASAEAHTGSDFVGRYPGELGNSLLVSVCDNDNAFSSSVSNVNITVGANTGTVAESTYLSVGDLLKVGNTTIGYQELKVVNVATTNSVSTLGFSSKYTLASDLTNETATRKWGFYRNVDKSPTDANTVHVVVVDEDGKFTGRKDVVLEVFEGVSLDANAMNYDGTSNYYKTVINNKSGYIYATGDDVTVSDSDGAVYSSLEGGADGLGEGSIATGDLATGYDLYASPEDVDISLVIAGKATGGSNEHVLANYIIDNICEVRKDCVVFISPDINDVVDNLSAVDDIVTFRNSLTKSSYGILDSGYKYQYDKYNDKYRWIPLNGDIAGLAARTDNVRDPWFSPAGYTRGVIKNVVKLAYNPKKFDRDILFSNDINPVVNQPGQGTFLFGDKTLNASSSAFDDINVRRLFIVLEKAIATAAKKMLFEFNDEFTRAQFRNLVEPFLRNVQGRRGIYDFRVVCDETNNTGDIIDRNEFVGDIYIKPARSIRYIQLNFIAVRTDVEFEEIVGQF